MSFRILLLAYIFFTTLYSCNLINPKENVPVNVTIDSISVQSTDYSKHGAVTSKLTDAWVYYDGKLLGAFELPARVPVVNTGTGELNILGGIYENGISATRQPYKLYQNYTVNLSKDTSSFHLNPILKYQPDLNFIFNCDFENGPGFIKRNGDTTLFQNSTSGEFLNGIYGGKLFLDANHKYAECITSEFFPISKTYPTYLELDYKNNAPFIIYGLYNSNGSFQVSELASVNPKNKWNKIYINLSSFAIGYNTEQVKLILAASLPTDSSTATILIDNLKILAIKQ